MINILLFEESVVIAIHLSSSLFSYTHPRKNGKSPHHSSEESVGSLGRNIPWNKVLVTNEMHQDLHRTRYAVYGNFNDGLAIRFRDGDQSSQHVMRNEPD